MGTLYDFLGALPDDDADSLRAAFRRAAKSAHPDNNPSDPDAALRFRQLVRANEILSDEQQRTTYDHLLQLARIEQEEAPKRAAAAAIERIVIRVTCGVMALAGVLIVAVEGYKLFLLTNGPALVHPQTAQVPGYEPPQAATFTTELSGTNGRADRNNKLEVAGAPEALDENLKDLKQAMAASVVASAQGIASAAVGGSAPATRDLATNDAKHYRERGISAYQNGDLYLALAGFNLAIQFDPGFSDAYIDRAIVFYRMGDQQRAFADIAQAKRIHHESNRK